MIKTFKTLAMALTVVKEIKMIISKVSIELKQTQLYLALSRPSLGEWHLTPILVQLRTIELKKVVFTFQLKWKKLFQTKSRSPIWLEVLH